MSLPDSRDLTFAALSTFPSATANALQDGVVSHESLLNAVVKGNDLSVYDEFLGDTLGVHLWTGSLPTGFTINTTDDVANGAFGALRVNVTTQNATRTLQTNSLKIGTSNFAVAFRYRFLGAGNGKLRMGLIGAGANDKFYISTNAGGGGDTSVAGIPGADANAFGYALVGTTYSGLVIKRIGGTVYFYQDGVLKHSEANTTNIASAKLTIELVQPNNTSYSDYYVDSIRCWVAR